MSVTNLYPDFIMEDLDKSGLKIADLAVRPLGANEKHATGSPQQGEGYVIPYYDIYGGILPFYRVRLKDWDPKYKQLTDSPNHIYFPRGFMELIEELSSSDELRYIILVEGEKKAACAVTKGLPACAVGGVDSWSNRTLSLPKDVKLTKGRDGSFVAKLSSETKSSMDVGELATGMQDLIDLLIKKDIPLVIIYDSDDRGKITPNVQAAAARLGYSLRFHGVKAKNIRQFILQPPKGYLRDKLGLDDLLQRTKVKKPQLDLAIRKVCEKPSAFPPHPNPREYVNKKLRRSRMSREQLQGLATSILCDLDSNGQRLYSSDEEELYYFSRQTHQLMRVSFRFNEIFSKSDFGVFLYQNYNLSIADDRVLTWLSTLYAGEEPIKAVEPERVLAIRDDAIYYQINDAQMIRVDADEIRVLDNGSDDILFLSDAVEPLNKNALVKNINGLLKKKQVPNYWLDVIQRTRIDDPSGKQAKLLSYLYSISPWFYRWRGTQLPMEMIIGEPGSGKSTLYQLRLTVLNGRPRLRNPSKDINDWGVSVGTTGGLHVTDNINMQDSKLRQQISDEMCRLITEPKPTIEKRKLYTDSDTVDLAVKTVFAVTSVNQPFNAPDIMQRSIITHMNKGSEAVEYAGDWAQEQLELFGGREGWIAQQLVFAHRLLQEIRANWVPKYGAKFRLVNVEQLMRMTATLYGEGEDDGAKWVTQFIEGSQAEKIADGDLVLGALKKFASAVISRYGEYNRNQRFSCKNIVEWMGEQDEYAKNNMLTNSRSLGRYMKNNPNLLATVAGISEAGSQSNATVYFAHLPKT